MKTKGFTLIELAVVLAIIAVLAAVLTPLVTGYLDQARVARAQADVRTIADAIKLHQRDTGRYPLYYVTNDYPGTVGNGAAVFAGPGNTPGNGLTTWSASIATTTLEGWINGNYSGGISTSNSFPKAAFRGPYVAAIESDPWGNKYLLTALHLNSGTNHAFVLSAGADGATDTAYTQLATSVLAVGDDDIVAVIK